MATEVCISRSALQHNVRVFRRVIAPTVRLMAVVKSNAYGHGVGECVPVFARAGVTWFGVASITEALHVRTLARRAHVLALSILEADPTRIAAAIRANVILPLFSFESLRRVKAVAQRLRSLARVHVKFDTGTTRIGFLPKSLPSVIQQLKHAPRIVPEGVYSHFAEVESKNQRYSQLQHQRFATLAEQLQLGLGKRLLQHMDCSAGVLMHADAHLDMVRVGMSLYGIPTVADLRAVQRQYPYVTLRPALSWYTDVLQVKRVPARTPIGYNRTYTTARSSRIAILPVGYWDGFDRRLSNRGFVAFGSYHLPVRGRVCMNLTMVDATRTPTVQDGSRIELLGPHIPAATQAALCGTIPYEIVARIHPLIPRHLTA